MAGYIPLDVHSEGNRIITKGDIRSSDMRRILASIHDVVNNKGFQDIILDMSEVSSAFAGPVLAISCQCQNLLKSGVDTYFIPPEYDKLRKLFNNANWAHLISPPQFEPSIFRGTTQIPAMKYNSAGDQFVAVQHILNVVLGSLKDFDRSHLSAIEWSINEITDNVINHSNSSIGGMVQLTSFSKNRKAIEYAVCDAGVGIPHTLRSGHPKIASDSEALDLAIREGVTRGTWAGQGNGLYGSWRVAVLTNGFFEVHSGYASLTYSPKKGLHVQHETIPYAGTLVVANIGYDKPLILDEALKFKDKPHKPVDHIEVSFEEDGEGNVIFPLSRESLGFGSRAAGETIRRKISNLLRMISGKVVVDFSDVPLVSSSYADEVFGKLFEDMGAIEFSNRINFKDADEIVRKLIDRAIRQRIRTGV